jgi:hypothetical protein
VSKPLGEMTPEERDAVIKDAVRRFQEELDRSAPEIGRILTEFEKEHGE